MIIEVSWHARQATLLTRRSRNLTNSLPPEHSEVCCRRTLSQAKMCARASFDLSVAPAFKLQLDLLRGALAPSGSPVAESS
jgi:hypothetical protein